MRKKLEEYEKQATSRAMFSCTNCSKCYDELEADRLYNSARDQFYCYICCGVLIIQADSSNQDKKLLMARFNEQMEPFYSLLRDVEGVRLEPSLLEPEPTDIPHLKRFSFPSARAFIQFTVELLRIIELLSDLLNMIAGTPILLSAMNHRKKICARKLLDKQVHTLPLLLVIETPRPKFARSSPFGWPKVPSILKLMLITRCLHLRLRYIIGSYSVRVG